MNDPLYQRLLEARWRRKLTASEEAELRAWLAAHPEMEADWLAESGLGGVLSSLPDAPVPTNFTARVLNAVNQEPAGSRPATTGWRWAWHRFLPRAAVAVLVAATGLITYERHEALQRAVLARNVATVADVAAVPNPELMKDFEAVRRLDQTPPADEELLALLR